MTGKRSSRSGQRDSAAPTFSDRFREVADRITHLAGTPWTMGLAAAVIIVWAVSGPLFGFSDKWQLVINSLTTIVTFLMVFAIQTSQNREAKATQIKLNELIRATKDARNSFIDEEHDPEDQVEADEREFESRRRSRR